MTFSVNILRAIPMEFIILIVSLLKLGKLVSNKCLVYFMTNRAVVYDTFVGVLLLSICRLFLHLTSSHKYVLCLYLSELEHLIQNHNKITRAKPLLDCIKFVCEALLQTNTFVVTCESSHCENMTESIH